MRAHTPGLLLNADIMMFQVGMALKLLYDEDIVEEELISAWFDKPTAGKVLGVDAKAAKVVRANAEPFVEWLQSAESEDEDEDEDENQEEGEE